VISVLNQMFGGQYDIHVSLQRDPSVANIEEDPVVKAAQRMGGTLRQM
jgi:hypothetical protein